MNLFQGRNGAQQNGDPEYVVSTLDSALTAIFSEDGKRTVLYYMSNKYGLTLEKASMDPKSLENALTGLLGEVGWMVVKKTILEHFWERKIGLQETDVVQRASLREAFGFAHGLGFNIRIGQF